MNRKREKKEKQTVHAQHSELGRARKPPLMGLCAKSSKNCKESWGMGLLLVFFPEDTTHGGDAASSPASATAINGHNKLFAIRRSNSSRILSRAQSTISICALLVFITLLLFTLSTFEPNARANSPIKVGSRRFLSESRNRNPNLASSRRFLSEMWRAPSSKSGDASPERALQGLGILHRRGTKAMADLLVGHVSDGTSDDELRLFLRALHRSGLTARSDVVLLFASSSPSFDSVIREENESFLRLVETHRSLNKTTPSGKKTGFFFDVNQFRESKKDVAEPLWGRKGVTPSLGNGSDESTRLSFGSVVGFEASDLDPENSLGGFLSDHVPMSLRRWACYPMLLGRVRRNYKHVSLVDAKNAIVFGDHLGQFKNRSPESVLLHAAGSTQRHGKRNPSGVNPWVVAGGARGVRRLAAAMLTEIVRTATSASAGKKKKGGGAVTESAVLSQLAANEFLLKNVKVVKSGETVPDATELGHNPASFWRHAVVQRGNGNGHELVKSVIMKQICSSEVDSSVYRDC